MTLEVHAAEDPDANLVHVLKSRQAPYSQTRLSGQSAFSAPYSPFDFLVKPQWPSARQLHQTCVQLA